MDEFAFLEGEFTGCINHFPADDRSSNLIKPHAWFSSVYMGTVLPGSYFYEKKKHFPFLGIRVSTGKVLALKEKEGV